MLVAIDVALGPLLTFVVFDRSKKNLRLDLACIGAMQLGALLYGLHALEAGRPHYLVFVKDRFEVVSRADLLPEDLEIARSNSAATTHWFRPSVVSVVFPASAEERRELLLESAFGGRDVQHLPKQYRKYELNSHQAVERSRPLDELLELNSNSHQVLEDAVEKTGLPKNDLRFLPIRGPKQDASMLLSLPSGDVVGMVNLRPWR